LVNIMFAVIVCLTKVLVSILTNYNCSRLSVTPYKRRVCGHVSTWWFRKNETVVNSIPFFGYLPKIKHLTSFSGTTLSFSKKGGWHAYRPTRYPSLWICNNDGNPTGFYTGEVLYFRSSGMVYLWPLIGQTDT
jgi:hypothetical protein